MKTCKPFALICIVAIIAVTTVLFACDEDETTYSVYTTTMHKDHVLGTSSGQTITASEFNSYRTSGIWVWHKWTEDEIKQWCIDTGFGENIANLMTSALIKSDHFQITYRTGDYVYLLIK